MEKTFIKTQDGKLEITEQPPVQKRIVSLGFLQKEREILLQRKASFEQKLRENQEAIEQCDVLNIKSDKEPIADIGEITSNK